MKEEVMDMINLRDIENKNIENEVNNYVNNLEELKILLKHDVLKKENNTIFINNINKLLNNIKSKEYHIALVGAIKAGKSTLINAILKNDLASTSVTPETASLTKFKSSNENNNLKVTFYTECEWKDLMDSVVEAKSDIFIDKYEELNAELERPNWVGKSKYFKEFENLVELKEELKKWTSCEYATHYFVKEVEIKNLDIPKGVVLVDTPGLDDPIKYRSNITRDYIERADAVLVCVNSKALTSTEVNTINGVFANARYRKEKIFIIGTQIDLLNNPIKDWEKQKEEWVKNLEKPSHYGSIDLAKNNIIGVSAYIENLIQMYNHNPNIEIKKSIYKVAMRFDLVDPFETISIEEKFIFSELQKYSSFNTLNRKLNDEIIAKHKIDMYESFICDYNDLKEEIIEQIYINKKRDEEMIDIINSNINEILAKKEVIKNQLIDSKEQKMQMEILMNHFGDYVKKGKREIFNKLDDEAKKILI